MLLTLPHHPKTKNSIPIKAKETPAFFIKLLEIWDLSSVAPVMQDDTHISFKVSNPTKPEILLFGGIGLFFPQTQGLSKVRSVLQSLFGEILCDDHQIIIPIVHTEVEHSALSNFLHEFLMDLSKPFTFSDSMEIHTILDLSIFRWHGIPNHTWRLSFTWACEKRGWPISPKKIEEFKKTAEILGIKSKFDIQNLQDFYDFLRKNPESKMQMLTSTYPSLTETFDLIQSDAPISTLKWGHHAEILILWLKNTFPWVDVELCQPPRSLEKSMKILIDPQKLMLLFLVNHSISVLKTQEISNFFKESGLLLTMDQVTACLNSFEHTDAAGNIIKLQYKIRGKSRVWVMSRTTTDGISSELSINPFYV
jgi:hypothetical protein